MIERTICSFLCTLLIATQSSPASDAERTDASDQLVRSYPGINVRREGGDVLAVYGRPMTSGATPDEAAAHWLNEHAGVFGVENLDLRLVRAMEMGYGNATVFFYEQFIDGVRVDNARARVTVSHGDPSRVVYASARLAHPPITGFRVTQTTGDGALQRVKHDPAFSYLTRWTEPELVVYYTDGRQKLAESQKAWKFQGSRRDDAVLAGFTFFVAAADASLLFVRDDVAHLADDITAHVDGKALPDETVIPWDGDPLSLETRPLDGACVRVVDDCPGPECTREDCTHTDANGDVTVPHAGTTRVDVEAVLVGPWVTVTDDNNDNNTPIIEPLLAQGVTPPGPVTFTFNDTPTAFDTAQVNAFVQITRLHDFFAARQPEFTELNCSIEAEVNSNNFLSIGCSADFLHLGAGQGTCDEGFFRFEAADAPSNCRNMAYSTPFAHEYGHFVIATLPNGPPNNEFPFPEGFCDALAILFYDDPLIADDACGEGTFIRDIVTSNVQYPCSGTQAVPGECFTNASDFYCGQVLAGAWWDIKLNLQTTLGDPNGLDTARQLFTSWMLIADDPPPDPGFNNGADPGTATEVLMADDLEYGDGDLSNGTPHLIEICEGFQSHNIACIDCNRNGVWDATDIAGVTSEDIVPAPDGNGVPDECDEIVYYFVKETATGRDDCTSWDDACVLQDALAEAAAANVLAQQFSQIWVKAGTHKPTTGTDRTAAFQLLVDTQVYGGFDGTEDPLVFDLDDRDLVTNETFLSGELRGPSTLDNSYHVVIATSYSSGPDTVFTDATAVLDGFTITAGNANGPVLSDGGGGLFSFQGSPTVRNCIFDDNDAKFGGGMYSGGDNSPTLTDCVFRFNGASENGGGVFVEKSGKLTLTDCSFEQNTTPGNGGGMYHFGTSVYSVLVDCRFDRNEAGTDGFGHGGGIYLSHTDNFLQGGVTRLNDCVFIDNIAEDNGGGFYVSRSKAWLTACRFYGNESTDGNGGGLWGDTHQDKLRLFNCLFSGNTSDGHGAAMYLEDVNNSAQTVVVNCSFSLNAGTGTFSKGGGLYNSAGDPVLSNCIFWGNTDNGQQTVEEAQIFVAGSTSPEISYCCIEGLDEIMGTGNIGTDPLFVDADGMNDLPGDEDDHLHLEVTSPSIDTGDNDAVPPGLTTDLDGGPRIADGDGDGVDEVDMGVYEFCPNDTCDDADVCTFDCCGGSPTCTNDGANPYADVAGGSWCGHPADCGPNGLVDLDDINAMLAAFGCDFAEGCEFHNYDITSGYNTPGQCLANSIIDLDEILAVIDAFGGDFWCCTESAQGGFPPSRTGSAGEAVALELELRDADPSAPQTIQVDIFAGPASDLQGYQMTVYVAGDVPGNVTLEGFYVDTTRPDFIFSEMDAVDAFDPIGWRFACARLGGGSAVIERAYLGTCVMHVADGATGLAQISLDATGGTMLRDSFSLPVDVILPDAMDLMLP